tara:strand:+ start:92 stop:547 length:456 start_codon:yes stop_codon:yes gene_type:complete
MKLLITFLLIFSVSLTIHSDDLQIEVIGKTTRQNSIVLPNGKKYVSFRHEGGFKSTLAKYGSYFCEGSIFYNKENLLENMNLFCELTDQNGDKQYTTGKRKVGSEVDIALGKTVIFDASGFWKKFIGLECTYVIEYVNNILFSPQKCKMPE